MGFVSALLVKEMLPEAIPLLCGANVTVRFALCPVASVSGNETPLRLNSPLVALADETVTLAPLALTVAVRLLFWLTTTLPKSNVVGDKISWPAPRRCAGERNRQAGV